MKVVKQGGTCAALLSFLAGLTACAAPAATTSAVARPAAMLSHGAHMDAFRVLLAQSRDLGPAAARTPVSVLLELRDSTTAQEAADQASIYDPHSPNFGRFQSPGKTQAAYGPRPGQVRTLERAMRAAGLRPRWTPGTTWLTAGGTVQVVDRVFRVDVRRYSHGSTFLASAVDPRVPPAWRRQVVSADHISTYPLLHNAGMPHLVASGGLTPPGLLSAYDIQSLRNLGLTGKGETVAFLEIEGYKTSDWDVFTRHYHLPPIRPEIVGTGFTGQFEGETEMDLEVVHEIAPQAKLVIYNENINASTDLEYLAKVLSFEHTMIDRTPRGIISESLGECELIDRGAFTRSLNSLYASAARFGESVFVSTGDSGAYTCLDDLSKRGVAPSQQWVSISALNGVNVTSVGGTNLSVRQNGSWYNERVWEQPVSTGGTGGGVSVYLSRPSYQNAPGTHDVVDNPKNMHSVPDVAADADPATGVSVYLGGQWQTGGGTSQAAPIWAGITALVNQYLQQKGLPPAGFVNPALYALARTKPAYPPYHDITQGNNLWYPATPGYDMASGLGSPDAWNLARDLVAYDRGHGR